MGRKITEIAVLLLDVSFNEKNMSAEGDQHRFLA